MHVVEVLAIGILLMFLIFTAFTIAEPVEKFFYAHSLDELVFYRGLLMMSVIAVNLPFGAAIVFGIPTGFILQRYLECKT